MYMQDRRAGERRESERGRGRKRGCVERKKEKRKPGIARKGQG